MVKILIAKIENYFSLHVTSILLLEVRPHQEFNLALGLYKAMFFTSTVCLPNLNSVEVSG